MTNHLEDIIKAIVENKVNFIIGGGVAAVLHGVERMTTDIDVSLEMSVQNVEHFLRVMKEIGLQPRVPVPGEVLLDKQSIEKIVKEKNALVFTFVDPNNPFRQIDVFLTKDLSYEQLIEDTETVELGGTPVTILSKKKLIQLKLQVDPIREKDKWDIEALRYLISKEESKDG